MHAVLGARYAAAIAALALSAPLPPRLRAFRGRTAWAPTCTAAIGPDGTRLFGVCLPICLLCDALPPGALTLRARVRSRRNPVWDDRGGRQSPL